MPESRSKGLCALTALWSAEGQVPGAESPQFQQLRPGDRTKVRSPRLSHVVLNGHGWLTLARVPAPHHLVWEGPRARAKKSINPPKNSRILQGTCDARPSRHPSLKLHLYPRGSLEPGFATSELIPRRAPVRSGWWELGTETDLEMHAWKDRMRLSLVCTGDELSITHLSRRVPGTGSG